MNNEEKILFILEKHSIMLEKQGADIETLKVSIEKHDATIETLVGAVGSLITSVGKLVNEQERTNKRLDNLEQGQAELQRGQISLEKEIADLKAATLRMEQSHSKKLDALFDSYNQTYDVNKELRKDIVALKSVQDKHELSIKFFDAQRKMEQEKIAHNTATQMMSTI